MIGRPESPQRLRRREERIEDGEKPEEAEIC